MDAILRFLGHAGTTMLLLLSVLAGILTAYWDARHFDRQGWRKDAAFARAVGWGIAMLGTIVFSAGAIARVLSR